ncbi:MAG: 50S ribosomal protein L20 [Acidobacteria bacterium]|nr:50S ribosomal protein L20 [Acidobacteriota bacterium]
MPRVKRGYKRKNQRKKYLKLTKGFYGGKSKLYRFAKEASERAGVFAFRDRRTRKREMRSLWIARINAAARKAGISYNRLISGLNKAGLLLDRKILAEIAAKDMPAFEKLVARAREFPPRSPRKPAAA